MKNKFFKSLLFRVVLLVIFVGVVPCIVLRIGILKSYESRAVSLRTADIQSQCTILCNQLSTSNYLAEPTSEVINAELTQLSSIYSGRVMIINKELNVVRDTYGLDEGKTIVSQDVIQCSKGESTNQYDNENRYIEVTSPIRELDSDKVLGVMLVSVSTDTIVDTLEILQVRANIVFGTISLLMIVLGCFCALRMMRPLKTLTQSVELVSQGYDQVDFQEHTYTETQLMSEALNKMIARLKVLDESRQEFVSNVSHELKTPLTSMKVLADSLISQENVPVELYEEFMGDIAQEIERENDIINDLLTLVKMDRTSPDLNIKPVDINELLELILKRLRPIAQTKNVEVVFESFRPVMAEIDQVKMTLALSNLVENAIKYNRENGWVHVSLNADHKFFFVKVEDSGCGIPEEEQEHVYERFYRVDKSHSREMGGTGLGLAITRNAVILHRGSITLESKPEEGTTFTVRIPLNYIM